MALKGLAVLRETFCRSNSNTETFDFLPANLSYQLRRALSQQPFFSLNFIVITCKICHQRHHKRTFLASLVLSSSIPLAHTFTAQRSKHTRNMRTLTYKQAHGTGPDRPQVLHCTDCGTRHRKTAGQGILT